MWNAKWRKILSLRKPGGGLFSTTVKACYVNLRKSGPMQVNLQTSWKLEPCYKPIDSLSPGSDSCPSDNTIPASSANSATSTIVELSIHDNAGKDNVSIIDNSTIVCTSPEIPPPNQSEPTDASLLSSSHEQSGSSFLGASRGNTPHSRRPN